MITRTQIILAGIALAAVGVALVATFTGPVWLQVGSLFTGFAVALGMVAVTLYQTRVPGVPWLWRSLLNLRDPLVLYADVLSVVTVLLVLHNVVADAGVASRVMAVVFMIAAVMAVLVAGAAASMRAAAGAEDGRGQKS